MTNGRPVHRIEDGFRSVPIPTARWWRRMLAFVGPAYLVSVGYMDPGNWATDLAGGSQFGYQLIWILLMSNAMAILLQTLAARLGVVTGRDLAQACRDEYPPLVRYVLFGLCEIAIAACDLAEVLGSAVGLNLLFRIPVLAGVLITGADVLVLLMLQRLGVRKIEAFIAGLVLMIGLGFIVEIFLCKPSPGGVASGLIPGRLSGDELYVAIGIIGATVMPHNLYLHSSLVQSRDVARRRETVAEACRSNLIDSAIALNGAFLVNAAILIVAAAAFWTHGIQVTELQQAPVLLEHVLGSRAARVIFAVALLCAGQSSTITGTLAGQITMEGFVNFHIRPWARRLITRLAAILPAVVVILMAGEASVYRLLIFSQVVLSLQLPFAVVPLVRFTGSRQKMGPFASRFWVHGLAWSVAAVLIGLNGKLLYEQIADWGARAGSNGWMVTAMVAPIAVALGGLLLWLIFRKEKPIEPILAVTPDEVVAGARAAKRQVRRIGAALEVKATDASIVAEAAALARTHEADLVLIHIVEGVGGQWYGPQTGDYESRNDEAYLQGVANSLKRELTPHGVSDVRAVLGFGDVPRQIMRIAVEQNLDLLVLGSHGHGGLEQLMYGRTIPTVRRALRIPVLVVRAEAAPASDSPQEPLTE